MASYVAIPASDYDPESPVTTSLVSAMINNPTAIAEGASGAPRIQTAAYQDGSVTNAKMAANAVKRTQVETSTETVSTTATEPGQNFVLSSGGWAFYPEIQVSSNNIANWRAALLDTENASVASGVYAGRITLVSNGSAQTIYARFRYISSSPPFDIGDGSVPLFVWALVDNGTKDIESVQVSQAPPWAYNGPTDITPSFVDEHGVKWRSLWVPRSSAGNKDKLTRSLAALRFPPKSRDEGQYELIEIDHKMKNADIDLIPHPFIAARRNGKSVVLLDTLSDDLVSLLERHTSGENVNEILHAGLLSIDGEQIPGRTNPSGVIQSRFRWKLTR